MSKDGSICNNTIVIASMTGNNKNYNYSTYKMKSCCLGCRCEIHFIASRPSYLLARRGHSFQGHILSTALATQGYAFVRR